MGKIDLIVIGNQGSGKTSLVRTYKEMTDPDLPKVVDTPEKPDEQQQLQLQQQCSGNGFSYVYQPTLGIELVSKKVIIKDVLYKICIWDTAGQEQFFALTKSYFQKADGVIIVFDITDAESYRRVSEYWIDQVKDKSDEKVKKILIGNKVDLLEERKVKFLDAKNLANHYGMEYFETSARTGEQVKEAFDYLARMCVNSLEVDEPVYPPMHLQVPAQPKKTGCADRFKDIFNQLLTRDTKK